MDKTLYHYLSCLIYPENTVSQPEEFTHPVQDGGYFQLVSVVLNEIKLQTWGGSLGYLVHICGAFYDTLLVHMSVAHLYLSRNAKN